MEMQTVKDRFGAFLAHELARKRLSQAEFAQLANIQQADISRYLKGQTMPSWDRFVRINEALRRNSGNTLNAVVYGDKATK